MIQKMVQKLENSENQKEGMENPDCLCPTTSCARHGKCLLCQAYHKNCGDKTWCGK